MLSVAWTGELSIEFFRAQTVDSLDQYYTIGVDQQLESMDIRWPHKTAAHYFVLTEDDLSDN